MNALTFEHLRETNVARCLDAFHTDISEWSLTDWACAMAGECGKVCNEIKKLRRGECITREMIGDELADLIIYADLLAARAGIDLAEAVRRKFNAVSAKRGSAVTL